jgi:hypothetical protein
MQVINNIGAKKTGKTALEWMAERQCRTANGQKKQQLKRKPMPLPASFYEDDEPYAEMREEDNL